MIEEILVERGIGETRTALIEGGRLAELLIDREDTAPRAGQLYLGRVVRVERSLQAAFVDCGAGRHGLLPEAETSGRTLPAEGQAVLVQVMRPAMADKGARLTARPSLPGRLTIYRPLGAGVAISSRIPDAAERERLSDIVAEFDGGTIVRTAAAGADGTAIARERAALLERWSDIRARADRAKAPCLIDGDGGPVERALRDHAAPSVRRILVDDAETLAAAKSYAAAQAPDLADRLARHDGPEALFDAYEVDREIEAALEPRVNLPGGGAITIEPTTALTAIDVDSAGDVGGRDRAETAFRTNLAAADEIARQIRLRGIGGNIVVDFIRMDGRRQPRRVIEALTAAFASDPAAVRIGGFSDLGLVEISRQRTRLPLAALMLEPSDAAAPRLAIPALRSLALRRALREAQAGPPGRLTVRCAPPVADALDAAAIGRLSRRAGRMIEVCADTGYERERIDIAIA